MTAGYNCFATIWRLTTPTDDVVGGAVPTGTPILTGVLTWLDSKAPEQILLQQGYETARTFVATVVPGYLDIQEKDELEVTAPVEHVYFGKRFRITGVQHSNLDRRDPRNYILLNLVRSVVSHEIQ